MNKHLPTKSLVIGAVSTLLGTFGGALSVAYYLVNHLTRPAIPGETDTYFFTEQSQKAPVLQAGDEWPSPLDMVLSLCYTCTMTQPEQPPTHINIRFPADLIAVLRQYAREDARSLHSEVLWILREYVKRRQPAG